MRPFSGSLVIVAALIGFAVAALSAPASAGELTKIKIGVLKVSACGPVFIAQEKGYFAKQGLSAELVSFDAPTVVSQGVMAGDLDFGLAAVSAGFFNTAGQGAMRVIAGDGEESPGFRGLVAIASNQAYDAGLKSLRDLAGNSFAITAAGTIQQYDLGVIAKKYGFDYASLRMVPVGSFPNMISGQFDRTRPAELGEMPDGTVYRLWRVRAPSETTSICTGSRSTCSA